MLKQLTLLMAFVVIFAAACNQATDSGEKDDMAQFTEDQEFNQSHQKPEAVTFEPKGEMMTFETPDGKKASAYALMTAEKSDKYLFVIHEWWGLNDHIKQEAESYFEGLENVNVLAIDMYDGKMADNPDDAGKLMQSVKPERANAIVNGAIAYAGEKAKIATVGWCFGGGWSLRSSILAGNKGVGCVIYYGMPVQEAKELAPLQADVLGIFGTKDKWINPEVVSNFEKLAKATGKKFESHSFDADHAFANPSNPGYIEEAAQKANQLSLAFLKEKLGA